MHVLYGLIAALVLAPAAFPGQVKSLVHLLLDHPLLSGLGVISYGVFLYNGPIAVWLSRSQLSGMWAGKPFLGILLGTVALTIPAAALSYRLIERPLLKLKDWRLSLPAAPVPAVQSELERPAG
jgi:peptidoglycan/LPS O-acetylase OafA/YrhL